MSEASMQRMEGRSFKGALSWVVGKGLQALYIVQVQDWAKNFSLWWLQAGPPKEFVGPGASLLWGPHDIIIFRLHVELL